MPTVVEEVSLELTTAVECALNWIRERDDAQ
jgi:hypothetical protein